MGNRHFLTLLDFTPSELAMLVNRATELKTMHHQGQVFEPLKNKVLGMIFEKSSTRTRVSFEAGIAQLGGSAIFLSPRDTQLGRGEPIEDSAKVLSRMCDIIMIRTFGHEVVEAFAKNSRVPVINALTDDFHPCQLLADMQTYQEHRGSIQGKIVTWVGDGNNMCQSYINAARQFDFKLVVSCPPGFEPNTALVDANKDRVVIEHDLKKAAIGSHLLVTDVWASMGQEDEQKEREKVFKPYQVSTELMDSADPEALFMHCLPAHRGEEVTHEMMDDPRAVVWDEAENRLHAQKALMEFLLNKDAN